MYNIAIMSDYVFKRKVFTIKELTDENSKIVERKGKLFKVQHFSNAKEFDKTLRINKVFSTSGIQVPKIRFLNKKENDIIFDHVEGDSIIEKLQYGDLPEEIYDELFKMYWRCKQEKIELDFNPLNFVFSGGKLYYLRTIYTVVQDRAEGQEKFLNKDLRFWFYTKEAVEFLKQNGLKTEGTLEEEYATNKRITLMCVKYYK